MLSTSFGFRELAHEFFELLDEVSHRVEVSLPNNGVKQDGFRRTLTILVMTVTVVVITAIVAPFVCYK